MATKKKTKTDKPAGEWWLVPANAPDENDTWVALVLVDRAEIQRAADGLARLKAEGIPVRSLDLHTARLWWFTERTVCELCDCDEIAEATRCDNDGPVLADAHLDERTECDVVTIWVDDGDAMWSCYPKHSDSRVETELFRVAPPKRKAVGG